MITFGSENIYDIREEEQKSLLEKERKSTKKAKASIKGGKKQTEEMKAPLLDE